MIAPPDRCMSQRELARYWRCAPARIRLLVRRGTLTAFRLGKRLRFSPAAIAEAERLLTAPASSPRRSPKANDRILPEIAAALADV